MNKYSIISASYSYIGADGIQHDGTSHPIFYSRLKDLASNAETLKHPEYINNLCIMFESADDISDPSKKGIIYQVGGYSPRRGLYVDYYDEHGRREA